MKARKVDDRADLQGIAGSFQFTGFLNRDGNSGMCFICPCGCGHEGYLPFERPGASLGARWAWDGNVDTPTLTPSVFNTGFPCKWHGWLRNGEWVEA